MHYDGRNATLSLILSAAALMVGAAGIIVMLLHTQFPGWRR
jgi:hypothetical protein